MAYLGNMTHEQQVKTLKNLRKLRMEILEIAQHLGKQTKEFSVCKDGAALKDFIDKDEGWEELINECHEQIEILQHRSS